jgi:hypothetical protein
MGGCRRGRAEGARSPEPAGRRGRFRGSFSPNLARGFRPPRIRIFVEPRTTDEESRRRPWGSGASHPGRGTRWNRRKTSRVGWVTLRYLPGQGSGEAARDHGRAEARSGSVDFETGSGFRLADIHPIDNPAGVTSHRLPFALILASSESDRTRLPHAFEMEKRFERERDDVIFPGRPSARSSPSVPRGVLSRARSSSPRGAFGSDTSAASLPTRPGGSPGSPPSRRSRAPTLSRRQGASLSVRTTPSTSQARRRGRSFDSGSGPRASREIPSGSSGSRVRRERSWKAPTDTCTSS